MKIKNIRQVLPPVTKADFTGLGSSELDRRVSNWGWTSLKSEVSPMVRMYFGIHNATGWTDFGITGDSKFRLPDRRSDDIFGRYGFLNGIQGDQALHTWTNMSDIIVIQGRRPEHPGVEPNTIYIPHAWATNVIAAAKEGIVRVTSVAVRKVTSPWFFVRIGHKASGEMLHVLSDGGSPSGFGYFQLPPWLEKQVKEKA